MASLAKLSPGAKCCVGLPSVERRNRQTRVEDKEFQIDTRIRTEATFENHARFDDGHGGDETLRIAGQGGKHGITFGFALEDSN